MSFFNIIDITRELKKKSKFYFDEYHESFVIFLNINDNRKIIRIFWISFEITINHILRSLK